MTGRDMFFFLLGGSFVGGVTYLVMSYKGKEEPEEAEVEVSQMPPDEPEEAPEEVEEEEPVKESVTKEEKPVESNSKSSGTTTETSTLDSYKAQKHIPEKEYFKIAGYYRSEVDVEDEGINAVEEEFLRNMTRDPERITPDVWKAGENGPYDHATLIYYPELDELRAEDTGEVIDLPYLLIGNTIEDHSFAYTDEAFMYVRNYKQQKDYEILKFNPSMVK